MIRDAITVIGSGAWGTALASIAAKKATFCYLVSRNKPVIDDVNRFHENKLYLPNIKLSPNIIATSDFTMVKKTTLVLVAVPAQHFRIIIEQLKKIDFNGHLVICCKGIEQDSLKLMSEIASEIMPSAKLAILSGPNFADEIASNLPAAATIASEDFELAQILAIELSNNHFRLYSAKDIISSQICGAAKNVLAIACGISIGKGLGENARAALITRGIAEIKRLAIAKGGHHGTILGLSGVGDIILTCNSSRSRNTSLGMELSQGKKLADILKERITIAEGVHTAKSITQLADKLNVKMPIAASINDILYNEGDVDQIIQALLSRPLNDE